MKNLIMKTTYNILAPNISMVIFTFENVKNVNFIDFREYMICKIGTELSITSITDNFVDTPLRVPYEKNKKYSESLLNENPEFNTLKYTSVFVNLIVEKSHSTSSFSDIFNYNPSDTTSPSRQYRLFVKQFANNGGLLFTNEATRKVSDTSYLYRRDLYGIFGNLGHLEKVKIVFSLKNSKVLK